VIVDASALVALLLRGPGWERIADALAAADAYATYGRGRHAASLDFGDCTSYAVARMAQDAYATYGRGRHAASLDFGDCTSYAVARMAQAPLLFVGNDFSQTDLEMALTT